MKSGQPTISGDTRGDCRGIPMSTIKKSLRELFCEGKVLRKRIEGEFRYQWVA